MRHCKITREAAYNLQGQMLAKVLPAVLPQALKQAGIPLDAVQSYIPAVQQALIPALAGALTQEQYGSQIALFAEENSRLIQNLQAQGGQGIQATVRPHVPPQPPRPEPRSAMNPFPVPPQVQQVPVQHQAPVPVNGNNQGPPFMPSDTPPGFTDDVVQG
jgi:hypothetical protein